MTVEMEKVANALREVYKKDIMNLPVSCDLVRLCRKFSILDYSSANSRYEKVPFTEDSTNDPSDKVIYALLHKISEKLYCVPPLEEEKVPDNDDLETFKKEVNLQVFETLTNYIINRFGEKSRVIRILKSCNQSFVIATLVHLRNALMQKQIMFKDCRGEWHLEVKTCPNGKPSVVQRRKEQVFKLTDSGLPKNMYRFEWEVQIEFDSCACKSIDSISIRLLGVDFTGVSNDDCPEDTRPALSEMFNAMFTNLVIATPALEFKLV